MTPVNRLALLTLAGLVIQAPAALAQNAGAEALFRDGRTLIKQGRLQEGCDKLEASEKLEASVGTLLNLGDCLEKLGKPASAWAAFREAESLAKRTGNDQKRQQEAKRRALKLEPDLANLTVQVNPRAKAAGVVVRRDDEVLDDALFGTGVVVDPGNHVIVAEAPGYRPFKAEVSVGKGGKRIVVVPGLDPVPAPPKPAAPPPVAVTPPPAPAPTPVVITQPQPPPARVIKIQHTWSTTRGLAVGLAIAGAGAIGTGLYYGNHANELQTQSNALCPMITCSDPAGLKLNDEAQDNARRANILFIAGGGAVAVATVMWFVGKPDETTVIAPAISDTHVGATMTRRF
jgi:hypothetical protein